MPRIPRPLRVFLHSLLAVTLAALTLAGIYATGTAWRPGDEPPAAGAVPPPHPRPAVDRPGTIVVAVVVGPGGSEIADVMGPYEVFARAAAVFDVYTVSTARAPAPLFGGPALLPDYSIMDVESGVAPAPDVVVVPRLDDPTGTIAPWVARRAALGSRVLGVCNGAYVLAAAGLLDGRRATAFWANLDSLAQRYPEVDWVRGQRFVQDGRITTTAGVSSGIPAALELVRQLAGPAHAARVGEAVGYPGWSPAAPTGIPVHERSLSDLSLALHQNLAWRPTIGVGLVAGAAEIDVAAIFDVYGTSSAARTVPLAAGPTVTTRHGMVLLTTPAGAGAPEIARLVVPTARSTQDLDPVLGRWAAARGLPVEPLDAARAPGESGFDSALRNLAVHTDRGTARTTAKFLEYPVSQLRLAGPSWPAGPFARLVLTLLAAVAVGLLPTAWRVVRRRRAGRPSPGTSPA